MSQIAAKTNAERPKPTCHHWRKPGHYGNQCHLLKTQRKPAENTQIIPGNETVASKTLFPRTTLTTITIKTAIEQTENQKLFVHPVRHVAKRTTPQRCYVGANAGNGPLRRKSKVEGQNGPQQQDAQHSITSCVRAAAQYLNYICHVSTPELGLTDQRPPERRFYQTQVLCGSNLSRNLWKVHVS